jgi:hypothetical protein
METTDSAYPVRFDIDYPEEPRNRLTLAFRLILDCRPRFGTVI